jgi:hypothetical protein
MVSNKDALRLWSYYAVEPPSQALSRVLAEYIPTSLDGWWVGATGDWG